MSQQKLYSYVVDHDDLTTPKSSLRRLSEGSLLVFYAGLKGWDFVCPPCRY
jgi:hypothetical protein